MEKVKTFEAETPTIIHFSLVRGLEAIFVFLVFLLPLKFGTLGVMPENPSMYQDSLTAWIILPWPPVFFTIFAGTFLLLVLVVLPLPKVRKFNPLLFVVLWVVLAAVSIIGSINASTWDYPVYEIIHMFGIAAFALAAYQLLSNNPKLKDWVIGAIFFSVLYTAYEAYNQYFWGFAETRKFVEYQQEKLGVNFVQGQFAERLNDSRVYATFSLCNAYAAHLILTIPLCLWIVWNFAKRIDQPQLARIILVPPVAVYILFPLLLTGSRGAILAFGAAIFGLLILLPFPKKIKYCFLTLIPVGFAIGIVIVAKRRGFLSGSVRLDYYLASLKMFLAHPFAGTGWGDFFHDYMRIKLFMTEEAPHSPHGMILAFASQCGILGLLASAAAIFYPIVAGIMKIWRHRKKLMPVSLPVAILTGWCAWAFHCQLDLNIHMSGSVATALVMIIIMGLPEDNEDAMMNPISRKSLFLVVWFVMILCVLGFSVYGGVSLLRHDIAFNQLNQLCDFRANMISHKKYMAIPPCEVYSELKKCEKISPQSPYPWAAAAGFMANHGCMKDAEKLYREAIKRSPERSSFYYRMFLLLYAMQRYDEAEKYLKKTKELFPNHDLYRRISMPVPRYRIDDSGLVEMYFRGLVRQVKKEEERQKNIK